MVDEYRLARHSQLLREEAETYLDPWMIQERRNNGVRPITFKEWLIGSRH